MSHDFCVPALLSFVIATSCFANTHHPQDVLNAMQGKKSEGMHIYKHFCSNCHAVTPLISLGAPRFAHKEDWAPRLKQEIAVLLQHTEEGFNAMPPRGGCFECSDTQLILALVTMLPEEDKKTLLDKLLDYKKIKR